MLCLNALELTVLESVHCPTCSTHYGLKASRVREGLRRARCFRCASVFSIEQEVERLLGPAAILPQDAGIGPEDLLDLDPLAEAVPAPAEAAPVLAEPAPSLTLGDLEAPDESLLEKTLITEPEQESQAEPAPGEESPDGGEGGFSSAKDAISKLLGALPPPSEHPQERRSLARSSTQMDVEATLDALESTLGGVHSQSLEGGSAPEAATSTMKLTHDEIASAMKAAATPLPSPRPVSAPRPLPSAPPPAPQPTRELSPEAEASLLKVRVGQDVYSNVSMDQITTWIGQGRVQDFHQVARQFSENWIEAGKVPSLRPVFERVRRQQAPAAQQAQAVILPPPGETAPIKKSLFGGLFNRG